LIEVSKDLADILLSLHNRSLPLNISPERFAARRTQAQTGEVLLLDTNGKVG
jgi:hypothetical protein